MATDTEVEFSAADLIGPAGSGSNGEKLVQSLLIHYPEKLRAALLKRINARLDEGIDSKRDDVAKMLGVDRVEGIHVRGGDQRESDAVVTYVWLDGQGKPWKGCFPYGDLANGELGDDTHVSQKGAMSKSHLATEWASENPRPQAAAAPAHADPFALSEMTAKELTDLMDEHPDKAEFIKNFEQAAHGKQARKTVLEHKPAGDASGDE